MPKGAGEFEATDWTSFRLSQPVTKLDGVDDVADGRDRRQSFAKIEQGLSLWCIWIEAGKFSGHQSILWRRP